MKVIINGCTGRMGSALSEQCRQAGVTVICGVDRRPCEYWYPVYGSLSLVSEKADVLIDFSAASALEEVLSYAERTSTPLVLATTGYTAEQNAWIIKTSESLPVFRSKNMSLGVSLAASLAAEAAKALGGDFDIEIIETHHSGKVDAPSGTALMIADEITGAVGGEHDYVFDRTGRREPRGKNEIGIQSVRGGGVVGDHTVMFLGKYESIAISHRAFDRSLFASGALRAAEFVSGLGPGLYSMKDLIASEVK